MRDFTARQSLEHWGIEAPIIQAPMAGTSTPRLAAAVSNAGALGSIALGAVDAETGRKMIRETRAATSRPFNVNLFVHLPARSDAVREAAWVQRLLPHFSAFDAAPPARLAEIYTSFRENPAMLAMLLEEKPAVVSFHFGLPPRDQVTQLKQAGITLLASATNLSEARLAADAGMDAIVAQGIEAGGHRGMFDPDAPDQELGTEALTRLLVKHLERPVIAAGGIMDGAGIARALDWGAAAAQLGTAFIASPESAADAGHRTALLLPGATTVMTRVISGRPARSLVNRFTALGETIDWGEIPAYPIAYDAGKALNAAAKAKGDFGYGAQWAGTGVARARAMPAADLVETLRSELAEARRRAGRGAGGWSTARRRCPC